jgi:HK97 gp10 family phage protein
VSGSVVDFKYHGLAEIRQAFDRLSTKEAKKLARRAVTKAARPVRTAARASAPVRSGWMKRGVDSVVRTYPRRGAVWAGVGIRSGLKPNPRLYAHLVHSGTTHRRTKRGYYRGQVIPNPFLERAYIETRSIAARIMFEEFARLTQPGGAA